MFETHDPTTGTRHATFDAHGVDEIGARLDALGAAQRGWARRPVAVRAEAVRALAGGMRGQADAAALDFAGEMGKPLAEGRAEVEKCAVTCERIAALGPGWLADVPVDVGGERCLVRHDPLGVVLAILPWNFPWWQAIRFAAPAWLVGNAVALKPAPTTVGSALRLEAACVAVGLPLRVVLAEDPAAWIADPRVHAVTLTGSERAGRAVGAAAGAALKKHVLELGGNDAFIVLDDVDVDAVAQAAVAGRLRNAGQSCISAKRFLVHRAVHGPFLAALSDAFAAVVVGDPRDPRVTMGPLARRDLRDGLHAQVTASLAAGARRVRGGEVPAGPGYFYPATILDGCGPGMPVWDDETFGPVAAVRAFDDDDDAVAHAEASRFALGASVWSPDLPRARRIADRLSAGSTFVNGIVQSDARVPFGGSRASGYGRELSRHGMLEFVNVRTLWG